jgi:tetratricopeptide (TPR) repeat protein
MKRLAVSILAAWAAGSSLVPGEAAARPWYWERVARPHGERVRMMIGRAQAELDEQSLFGRSLEGATRAEALLEQALRLEPASFLATVLMGDSLAAQGRGIEAISFFQRACALSETADEESWCTLRLAIERSKEGQYVEAVEEYDRHVRLGQARGATYANSAEVLMALGRLGEAEARYREAVRITEEEPAGPDRDQNLALALYGLAVALDRDEQIAAAQEAMVRALSHDPKLALLASASNTPSPSPAPPIRVGEPPLSGGPLPAPDSTGVFFVAFLHDRGV